MSEPISLVFFGSGPVAAKSLSLLSKNFRVEAVITKPRPDHHRGNVPVLDHCVRESLPYYTVRNKTELSELFTTLKCTSQIGVVIDFGIIIAQDVIDYFPLGIINSHFSLLPEWRGADPISFSILSGQTQTGISVMLIDDKMDEGPLLAQAAYDLPADITTPQLTDELIALSDSTLTDIIPLYVAGKAIPAPQADVTIAESKTPSYSRKLTKDDSILDFTKEAAELEREIRAFSEWPKSRTTLGDKEIIATRAHVQDGNGFVGNIWRDARSFGFYTSDGVLVIDTLKPSGKQDMTAQAFIAGYKNLLD